jgi:hypothetical protein
LASNPAATWHAWQALSRQVFIVKEMFSRRVAKMKVQALKEIWSAIDAITCDDSAKHQFKQLIRDIGRRHGVKIIALTERVNIASDLISRGIPRLVVRDRLVSRFHINERTANRIITEALQIGQKRKVCVSRMYLNVGECSESQLTEVTKNVDENNPA